jgi:hypothetical protein
MNVSRIVCTSPLIILNWTGKNQQNIINSNITTKEAGDSKLSLNCLILVTVNIGDISLAIAILIDPMSACPIRLSNTDVNALAFGDANVSGE